MPAQSTLNPFKNGLNYSIKQPSVNTPFPYPCTCKNQGRKRFPSEPPIPSPQSAQQKQRASLLPCSGYPDLVHWLSLDPNRDPRLPTFYEVYNHPLWPHRRALVYVADPKDLKHNYDYYSSLQIPNSIDKVELSKMGLFELLPNDAILCRWADGSGLPEHDIPKAWVVGKDEVKQQLPDFVQELIDVRVDMLGPRETRDARNSKTISFEQNRNAHSKQGDHCYPIALTQEEQRGQLFHPCANIRTFTRPNDAKDELGYRIQTRLNMVCAYIYLVHMIILMYFIELR